MIEHVRELNGGDLDDDLAILALGYCPGPMSEGQRAEAGRRWPLSRIVGGARAGLQAVGPGQAEPQAVGAAWRGTEGGVGGRAIGHGGEGGS